MTDWALLERGCIAIIDHQWGRDVRSRLSVMDYEGRRTERIFGHKRLVWTTPPVEALTTERGPGFHQAQIIDAELYEAQMLHYLGLA